MVGLCKGSHELSGSLKVGQLMLIVSVIYYVKHEFTEQFKSIGIYVELFCSLIIHVLFVFVSICVKKCHGSDCQLSVEMSCLC